MGKELFDEESKKTVDEFAREMQRSWIGQRSLEEFGHTLAGNIITRLFDELPLDIEDRIENSVKDIGGNKVSGINTFPFGDKTDVIFPQWIGVYREKTKMPGLNAMIKSIESYCKKSNTGLNQNKELFILTDVWNGKFEEKILRATIPFYKRDNVIVRIFLYNDYGITIVPFLFSFSWPSPEKLKLLDEKLDKLSYDDVFYELCSERIYYSLHFSSTWDMYNKEYNGCDTYTIDLRKRVCIKEERGKINEIILSKRAIDTFIRKIAGLKNEISAYQGHNLNLPLDCHCVKEVCIMRKILEWCNESNPVEHGVETAIRELCGIKE